MYYILLEKLANKLASWKEEKGLQSHSKEKRSEMYKVLWEVTEQSLPEGLCVL